MGTRILFYSLGFAMILVSGAALYYLFKGKDDSELLKIEASKSKSGPENSKEGPESGSSSSRFDKQRRSVWDDPRFKEGKVDRGISDQLKVSAEISNNIDKLMKLYNDGSDLEFLTQIQELIDENPRVPEYVALLGDYYYNEGKWQEAEMAVQKLIELDPENLYAKTSLGELQGIQGRFEEAQITLDSVVAKDPSNLDALYGILSVAQMQGDPQTGARRVEAIAKANPQSIGAAMVLADVLQTEGRVEERKALLERARQQDPNHSGLIRLMASDASRLGDHQKAIQLAGDAFQKDQKKESKLQSLDLILQSALASQQFDLADETVRRKRMLSPDDKSLDMQEEMVREARKRP